MLCTRTIPYIFTELSPLTIYSLIMIACPGHVLESTVGIEIKLGTYIDVNEGKWFSLSCLGVQVVLDYKFCLL